MFKMGCMARKILAPGSSSSSSSNDNASPGDTGGGAKKSKSKPPAKQSEAAHHQPSAQQSAASQPPAAAGPVKTDELGDFSKLEDDPRLPLNKRQIFKISKSWKAIARTMSKTGTAMFLNLFEQNQDLFRLFDRFQHLKGPRELHESMELREHAATVMSTLDQSINSLSDYDNFITYLHSIGQLHHKVPGFKREYFWRIEQPFMKAVKQTLDERCNETIEEIYKIAIKLIIETIADGYGADQVEGPPSAGSGKDESTPDANGGDGGGGGGGRAAEGREAASGDGDGDGGGGNGAAGNTGPQAAPNGPQSRSVRQRNGEQQNGGATKSDEAAQSESELESLEAQELSADELQPSGSGRTNIQPVGSACVGGPLADGQTRARRRRGGEASGGRAPTTDDSPHWKATDLAATGRLFSPGKQARPLAGPRQVAANCSDGERRADAKGLSGATKVAERGREEALMEKQASLLLQKLQWTVATAPFQVGPTRAQASSSNANTNTNTTTTTNNNNNNDNNEKQNPHCSQDGQLRSHQATDSHRLAARGQQEELVASRLLAMIFALQRAGSANGICGPVQCGGSMRAAQHLSAPEFGESDGGASQMWPTPTTPLRAAQINDAAASDSNLKSQLQRQTLANA